MRFDQITAAVTRIVAITDVRAIKAGRWFANALCLHLWRNRMPLGMPAYAGSPSVCSLLDEHGDGIGCPMPGSKRGRVLPQSLWVQTSCPAESVLA